MPRLLPVRFSRIALLLLVAGLVLWASFGTSGQSAAQRIPPDYGDLRLYRDITAQVAAGKNYYEATTLLQREHHYPLRPFYTVRPPLLAWVNGWFGDLIWPAALLLALAVFTWLHSLGERSILERVVALLCMLAAALPLVFSPFRAVHDMWSGLFTTIALGLTATRLAIIPATLAVLVRELNFPLLGLFALDRRSRSAALFAGVLCIAAFGFHRAAVLAWTLPGDPASQGWLGLRGPAGWAEDLSRNSILQLMPPPVAVLLAFAPVLGWVELGRWRALAWFLGVFALVAIFARPDNSYWCLNVLPAWFIGLAFVPAYLRSLITPPDCAPPSP